MHGCVLKWIPLPQLFRRCPLQPLDVRRLGWLNPSPEPLGSLMPSYFLVFHLSNLLLHNNMDAVYVSLHRPPVLLITFFLFNEFQQLLVLSACTGQQTTYTPLLLQKQGLHPTCWQIKVLQVFVLGLPMASVLTEFPALLPPTKWLCRNSWLWLLSVVETRFFVLVLLSYANMLLFLTMCLMIGTVS